MKKLVLVAALFMFVCGGTFLAQAKAPVEQPSKTTTLSNDTVVTDTLQKAENVQDTAKSGPITVSTLQQKSRFLLVYSGKRLFKLIVDSYQLRNHQCLSG